jgi:hypothetical protein
MLKFHFYMFTHYIKFIKGYICVSCYTLLLLLSNTETAER